MIRNYKDDLLSDQSWYTGNSILISGRRGGEGGGCEAEDGNEGEIGQNSSSSVVVVLLLFLIVFFIAASLASSRFDHMALSFSPQRLLVPPLFAP